MPYAPLTATHPHQHAHRGTTPLIASLTVNTACSATNHAKGSVWERKSLPTLVV